MRLHMGCGSVYLKGWLNVDVPGANTFLANSRPDLVEKWITEDTDYYGRHKGVSIESLRKGPLNQDTVCDRYGSFAFLPVNEPVEQVLSRQAFEHLSSSEAKQALRQLHEAIRPGGWLTLDVPNHAATLNLLIETRDPFYIRHLLGPKRDHYGVHMQSYSLTGLASLVEAHGFTFRQEEKNIHLYPSICARFQRNP